MFRRSDAAFDEAVSWFTRFQLGEPDEQERLRFAAWLRDPAHRSAYVEAERTFAVLRQARDAGLLRAKPRPRPFPTRWMVAAAALLIGAASVGLLYLQVRGDYRTAPGEMRIVTLEDGSTLHMNGGTRLVVRFTDAQRRVELREGEALFQVTRDAGRPFRVDAGNQIVQVVGTAFDVARSAARVDIAVAEGVVDVLPAQAPTPIPVPRVQLRPGQAIAYEGSAAASGVRSIPVERVGAWRHGELIFESVPFARILEALGRQYGGRFVADDPALARRSVSLQLNPQSRAEMIRFIEQTMSLRAEQRSGGTVAFLPLARK
jgi:transmembrane sensor